MTVVGLEGHLPIVVSLERRGEPPFGIRETAEDQGPIGGMSAAQSSRFTLEIFPSRHLDFLQGTSRCNLVAKKQRARSLAAPVRS